MCYLLSLECRDSLGSLITSSITCANAAMLQPLVRLRASHCCRLWSVTSSDRHSVLLYTTSRCSTSSSNCLCTAAIARELLPAVACAYNTTFVSAIDWLWLVGTVQLICALPRPHCSRCNESRHKADICRGAVWCSAVIIITLITQTMIILATFAAIA